MLMDIDKNRDDDESELPENPFIMWRMNLKPEYGQYSAPVPGDLEVLGMSIQQNIVIWGRCHIATPPRDRVFLVGHPDLILPEQGAKYIGTWQMAIMAEEDLILTNEPKEPKLEFYIAHVFDLGWKDELKKNVK